MMAFRFFQGVGTGGEVPIASAYINEFIGAEKRGRFFLLYEVIFPVGLLAVALVSTWAVPNLGWQWMFVIGALPVLLAALLRRLVPESPRWLASAGRLDEAGRAMRAIEDEISRQGGRPLPPLPASFREVAAARASWRDLFSGVYLPRTLAVWVMWFCTYLIVYGISGWLPTIYRTIFKLPLQQALQYSLAATTAGLVGALACAYLIDRTGRRLWFAMAFFAGAVPLFILWMRGTGSSAVDVMIYASLSYAMINTLALGLYLYTPEIYPTRVRALGSGAATAWLRVASMIGPFMIGAILPQAGLGTVFLVFGVAAVAGGVVAALFTLETRGRVLEEIAP